MYKKKTIKKLLRSFIMIFLKLINMNTIINKYKPII